MIRSMVRCDKVTSPLAAARARITPSGGGCPMGLRVKQLRDATRVRPAPAHTKGCLKTPTLRAARQADRSKGHSVQASIGLLDSTGAAPCSAEGRRRLSQPSLERAAETRFGVVTSALSDVGNRRIA